MKKRLLPIIVCCCLLTACAPSHTAEPTTQPAPETTQAPVTETTAATEPTAAPVQVSPLPAGIDLNSLDNCTLAVSLKEGDAYVDDEGAMQMKLTVYTYDRYDMVDIAQLKDGDVLTIDGQEIAVASVERSEQSGVLVNGGLENGGYTLRTEEDGTFFVSLENDAKSWHALGEATIRVSQDFLFTDNAQQPPVTYYPGDFLVEGTGIDYDFTPNNTTVTIENGRIIAMNRVYVP